jgi:hypothetical protein
MMHRESADSYRGEIVRLDGWRVAVCADGLQWLLQRRDPANAMAGPRWRTLGFCRSRSALIRRWQRASGDDGAALGNLPPHFAPKPRAGARQEPQVGFSRPRGGEKDLAPVAAFLGGALE